MEGVFRREMNRRRKARERRMRARDEETNTLGDVDGQIGFY